MRFGRADYDAAIIDTSGKIPDDEPCLLIRAQDPIGPEMAKEYAHKSRVRGDTAMADSAQDLAREMERWQQTKTVLPKAADLPDVERPEASSMRMGKSARILPERIHLVGDAVAPGKCRILDAETSQPVKVPITAIKFEARMEEPNRITLEIAHTAFEGKGEAVWQIDEDSLRALAAANGFSLVKADGVMPVEERPE